jgi:hypothetical protein
MNSFIASQIKEIAAELIIDALESDRNAIDTANSIRDEIKAGWLAAMEASGMPPEMAEKLAL